MRTVKIGIWYVIGANMNVWFAERRKNKDDWDLVNELAESEGTWYILTIQESRWKEQEVGINRKHQLNLKDIKR